MGKALKPQPGKPDMPPSLRNAPMLRPCCWRIRRTIRPKLVLIGLKLVPAGLDAIAGMEGSFSRDGVTFLRPWLDVTRERPPASARIWARMVGRSDQRSPTRSGKTVCRRTVHCRRTIRYAHAYAHDLMPYLQRFAGAMSFRGFQSARDLRRPTRIISTSGRRRSPNGR